MCRKKILLIFFTVIVVVNCELQRHITSFHMEHFFGTNDGESRLYMAPSDRGNDLYYAECDISKNSTKSTCTVTVDIPVDVGAIFQKSCHVSVTAWNNDHFRSSSKYLIPINQTNTLLKVRSEYNNEIFWAVYSIRMPDCKVVEIILPGLNIESKIDIANNENHLDFFYTTEKNSNLSGLDCQKNICRITYNLNNGSVIRDSMKFMEKPDSLRQMRFLYIGNSLKIIMIANDHNILELYRVHNATIESLTTISGFGGYSTSNGKFSWFRLKDKSNVIIRQYDAKNHHLADFSLSHVDRLKDSKYSPILYNLRDHGLIFLHVEFTSNFEFVDTIKIFRFVNDSQSTLPLEIPFREFDFKDEVEFKFLEDETKFCLKAISKNDDRVEENSYLFYETFCFPKDYFDGFSGVSTSYSKRSFCLDNGDDAICQQYDSKSKLLININLNLSDYSKDQENVRLIPYNLQNGGLIILLIEYTNGWRNFNSKVDNFKVLHVRNDSQYASPLKIPYGDMNFIGLVDCSFEETDTELCLKLNSTNYLGHGRHDYSKNSTKCFPKYLLDGFLGVSTSHLRKSFCKIDNDNITCQQFDLKSELLINFNVKLSDYSMNPKNIRIYPYNLRDGGLLVALAEFKDEWETLEKEIHNLRIFRVFNDGRYTLPLRIYYVDINFTGLIECNFEENDTEICIKLISDNPLNHKNSKNTENNSKCILKNYFVDMY